MHRTYFVSCNYSSSLICGPDKISKSATSLLESYFQHLQFRGSNSNQSNNLPFFLLLSKIDQCVESNTILKRFYFILFFFHRGRLD